MTDSICGSTDTHSGDPCLRPAGWGTDVDEGHCITHAEDGEEPGGRPSKFEDVKDILLEAATQPKTKEGVARSAGITYETLRTYEQKYPEFSVSLTRARGEAETRLIVRGLDPDDNVDTSFLKFLLERSFGYTKSQEIEHTGDGFDLTLSTQDKEQLDELFDREVQL